MTPPSESGGQLALADRLLYHRTGLQTIVAYDAGTGQEHWTYRRPFEEQGNFLRSFAVRDHVLAVYCACDTVSQRRSGWLLAVEAAPRWQHWLALLGIAR